MNAFREQKCGRLSCVLFDSTPEALPERVVLMCHGFGASGEDLVPLAPELVRLDPAGLARTRFVFPAAPLDLAQFGIPGGRAWWPIDMMKLQRASQTGEFRDLRREVPSAMPQVRELLSETVDVLKKETGLGIDRFVLGGFSQGSMATTDLMLHLDTKPGGQIVFSGTLLCEDAWRSRAKGLAGLRIMQSHGTMDNILPFSLAEELRDLFRDGGAEVDWVPFRNGHTIPGEAMRAAAKLIGAVTGS